MYLLRTRLVVYCCRLIRSMWGSVNPVNTKHLYNICTLLDQRRRRWANNIQMFCVCWEVGYRMQLRSVIFRYTVYFLLHVLEKHET